MLRVNSEQNTENGQSAPGSTSEKGGSKKVAFIDTVFPTVGVFIAAEIEYLRKQGIDVVILPLRKSEVPFLQDEYRNLIPHIVPRKSIWSMRLSFLATLLILLRPHLVVKAIADALWDLKGDPVYFLKTAAMLPQLLPIAVMLERDGIKHVHGNWAHYPATAARLIARLLRGTYSFSAHAGADIYRHPEGLERKIRDASFVNTCTQTNLDYLESLCECSLNGRVKVIYHGIDLSRFDASSAAPDTPPLLLSVGNLSEAKGFRYAIEACRILKEKGLDFRYILDNFARGRTGRYPERLGGSNGNGSARRCFRSVRNPRIGEARSKWTLGSASRFTSAGAKHRTITDRLDSAVELRSAGATDCS
jgi:glycosyltransferase involved in cell wall biosynthesis